MRPFCWVVVVLGAVLFGMTLTFFGETPEPKVGDAHGALECKARSEDYAFRQEVDPTTGEWKSPEWEYDKSTLLGRLGVLPPHTAYRVLAALLFISGLSLIVQPWRRFSKGMGR